MIKFNVLFFYCSFEGIYQVYFNKIEFDNPKLKHYKQIFEGLFNKSLDLHNIDYCENIFTKKNICNIIQHPKRYC